MAAASWLDVLLCGEGFEIHTSMPPELAETQTWMSPPLCGRAVFTCVGDPVYLQRLQQNDGIFCLQVLLPY